MAQHDHQQVAAFGGLAVADWDHGVGILCRGGVLPAFRGQGLQLRLIRARVKKAKQLGLERLYSYTLTYNVASARSLVNAGFKPTELPRGWGERDFNYWEKTL